MELVSRKTAISLGLKRYFTGKSCKHGHLAEKFVASCACVDCTASNTKKWISSSPTAKEVRKRGTDAFFSRNESYKSDWRADNGDLCRKYARRWYVKDPAKRIAKTQDWQNANREKVRTNVRNRTALRKSAEGSHTAEEILAILERQNWICVYCPASIRERRHMDHIVPLSKGGSNNADNIQGSCPTCNMRKSDKLPEEWERELGLLT